MKPFLPLVVALSLLLPGAGLHAADSPVQADDEVTDSAVLPKLELTPSLLYQLLLAEIAGQRRQLPQAALLYRELATATRDPRIARRATEVALHARQPEMAMENARLWQQLEPASPQMRQTLIRLLAGLGRKEELTREVAALLAAEPLQLPQNLSHLNRLFARTADRQAARAVIDAVTQPYLALPEAHYARAVAALEARDLAAARQAVERVLELRPDSEPAALFRFQIADDRAAALNQLGEFVERHGLARDARLAYARALVGEKRYADARREFDRLLEPVAGSNGPDGDVVFAVAVLSLQLNDTAKAEQHLRRLIEMGHAEADKARFYLGQIADEGKRSDEALKWFGAIGRGEHFVPARLRTAALLAQQGQLDSARQLLQVSDVPPREQVQLRIGEAQLLREHGDAAGAHAVLVTGLAADPDQPELLYEAALMAERIGRHDELETRLRRLIELRPDHAHAHNALGYSLAERNQRLDEARRLIERALELAPNDPFILDSQGWVLFRQGNTTAALEALHRAFGIRPDPEIAAHLGEVLWMLGRKDEARQVWDGSRRDHPANEVLAETIKRFLP